MKWGILLAALTGVLLIMQLLLVTVALGAAFNAASTSGSDSCAAPAGAGSSGSSGGSGKAYAIGDSIMVGLTGVSTPDQAAAGTTVENSPLGKALKQKGLSLASNAVGARQLDEGIEDMRADKEIIAKADTVIVEFGTNQSFPDEFKQQVNQMVEQVKAYNSGAKVYWVDIFSKVPQRERYNDVLEKAGNITVINTGGKNYDHNGDGIHPGSLAGQEKLAKVIAEGLSGSANPTTSSGDDCDDEAADGGAVSGDVKSLAQQLLDSGNAAFPLDASSGNGSTLEVVKAMAKGEKAYTTCPGGAKKDEVNVSEGLMKFLVELTKDGKVGINAITDKCHSTGSNHYKGIAVDFECRHMPFNTAKADQIAKKYGGARNGETCAAHYHWHYDFNK